MELAPTMSEEPVVPETPSPFPRIDYRQVALGAMLPDLIDRTLRRYVVGGSLRDNDHIFGHTVLMNLPVLILGLRTARRGDPRLLGVGVAAMTHLVADPIARVPRTLFWPLLGLKFPAVHGFGTRVTMASQATAALVTLVVLYALWKRRGLPGFFRSGRL